MTDPGTKRRLSRRVCDVDTSEEPAEVTGVDAGLAGYEELARAILSHARLPDRPGGFMRAASGPLVAMPATQAETLQLVHRGWEPVTLWGTVKRDDLIGRAGRVMWHAHGVRTAMAAGHKDNVAWHAMRFGQEGTMLEIDAKGWIRAAEVGDAISRGGGKGGRSKRDKDPGRIEIRSSVVDAAAAKLAKGWRLGKSELARRLAKEHGLEFNTVRDWLKPLPNSGGGSS